mmetsp:Transcript_37856/g.33875  ORF Transcript_37856/g.33875 Transcript_37856/m.33875 type:complete len:164 (-) Transcript_37856:747-1238(-)
MIELEIGGQGPFKLQIDTGSGILWVPNPGIKYFKNHYKCSDSEDCVDLHEEDVLSYLDGQYIGNIVQDTIKIGDSKFTTKLIAISIDDDDTIAQANDGLIGLCSSGDPYFPKLFIEDLRHQGFIDEARFSLFIGPSDWNATYAKGGGLVFGGVDKEYYQNSNG